MATTKGAQESSVTEKSVPVPTTKEKRMTKPRLSHDDAKTAEWLSDNLVEWEFDREFPIDKINFEESLNNQARFKNPIIEDTVQVYAEAMENGDQFPACVGYMKNHKLVFIDGNHRGQAAALLDSETLPVFIVKNAPVDMILKLTYEANAKQGPPNSPEERLEHAMWLVRSGHNQHNAAALMNIKVSDLRSSLLKSEADRRAAALSIKRQTWNSFGSTSRKRLNAIKSDAAFKKAVDVSHKLGLKTDKISALVGDINRVKTNAEQLKVVDQYIDAHSTEAQIASRKNKTNLRYLVRTHSQALMVDLNRDDLYENLPPQEAAEIKAILRKLVREVNAAIKEFAQHE